MSLRNGRRRKFARFWKRVVGLGPAPWIAACVLVATVGVAAVYGGIDETRELPPTSHEQVAQVLATGGHDLQLDSDLDGLPDALENYAYGTDPEDWDTSGDGVPDGWLARYDMDPLDPTTASRAAGVPPSDALPPVYRGIWPYEYAMTVADYYQHGRPDNWSEERDGVHWNHLDPTDWDVNDDGIADSWLLHHGLDPLNTSLASVPLAGSAGLTVREAFENGTNPRKADTDGDGLDDRAEIAGTVMIGGAATSFSPTDPRRFSTAGTSVCDGYLVRRGLDAHAPETSLGDPDNDGASTAEEYNWTRAAFGDAACRSVVGLDPTAYSTAGSSLADGWLIRYGVNPLDEAAADAVTETASAVPGEMPMSEMVLRVKDEYAVNRPETWDEADRGPWWGGTDPGRNDTDGDGVDDVHELQGRLLEIFGDPGDTNATRIHAVSDPTRPDADGDGLTDLVERDLGTHPGQADTDFDGIPDGAEEALGLDPTRADTAGDLLRDGDRLNLLRLRQGRALAGDDYEFLGDPGAPRTYASVAASQVGGASLPSNPPPSAVAALFGPDGDMDGDGVRNLLDRDMDDDTLLNGWEVRPETYASSPVGVGPFASGRSVTDPLNPDTDDDDLFDAWEVEFARARFSLGGFDPDPARWDTDFDGVSDAHEDPDGDSIKWVRFVAGGERTESEYLHTNLQEQQFSTDPHTFDTDEDGLSDGWKVFWGILYPASGHAAVPPSALRPQPGVHQGDIVTASVATVRFTGEPSERAAHETAVGSPVTVTDADGATHAVFAVSGTYGFSFVDEQAAQTNPYLDDTDLDGLPDAWEYYEASIRHRPPADARAQCSPSLPPSPIVQDEEDDQDGDGVPAAEEFQHGSDPLCVDTDMGGADDGQEILFGDGLSPKDTADDQFLFDRDRDADGDGISDFEEITQTRTDPTNPDTDGDGLLDGATLPVDQAQTWDPSDPRTVNFLSLGIAYERRTNDDGSNGFRFLGEASFSTSPTQPSQRGDGVPDGWVLSHGGFTVENLPGWAKACYVHGLPPWWQIATHGPWWGGGDPFEDDCTTLADRRDTDNDGLDDILGEDPIPVANYENVYRLGDPREPGIEPGERRERAQAIVDPSVLQPNRVLRSAGADEPARTPVRIEGLPADPIPVVRGHTTNIQGRVVTQGDDIGVDGLTVVVSHAGNVYGVAFTDAAGEFDVPLRLVAGHSVVLDRPEVVLFSQTNGTVEWETPPETIPPGPVTFTVYSYATPVRSDGNAYASAMSEVDVTVDIVANATIDAPHIVHVGERFDVAVEVKDDAGVPLRDPIEVTWQGVTLGPFSPSDSGVAAFELTAPTDSAGAKTLRVQTNPTSDHVSSAEHTVEIVVRRIAQMRITAAPAAVDAGDGVDVEGRASTSAGPQAGEVVAVTLTGPNGSVGQVAATTDNQGRFVASLPVRPNLVTGSFVLRASMDATDAHTSASDTRLVSVRARPVVVDATSPTLRSSGPHSIPITLVSSQNEPLEGKTLTMILGDQAKQAATDGDGVATFVFPHDMPVGPLVQRIVFDGDASYAPVTKSRDRFVLAETALAVRHGDVAPGGTAEISIELMDETGRPLRSQPVRVEWTVGLATVVLTGDDGTASASFDVPEDAPLGPIVVRATFEGDPAGTLRESHGVGTWRVRSSAHIEIPDTAVRTGVAVPPGRLVDGAGSPIQNAAVDVAVDESESRRERTSETGAFPLIGGSGTFSKAGEVTVSVAYAGTDRYEQTSISTVLQVKAPTNLSLEESGHLVAGGKARLVIQVNDADAVPVQTGRVTVELGGEQIGGADVKDGAAVVEAVIPADAPRGATKLVVHFHGTQTQEPARVDVPVSVVVASQLAIFVAESGPGEPLALRIQARTVDGPLAQARVLVRTANDPAGLVVTTDAQGGARAVVAPPEGESVITVTYLGSQSSTAAKTSALVTPHIRESPNPLSGWMIGAVTVSLVALLAAVGYYVAMRRRRHPLLEGLRRAERAIDARGPYEFDVMVAYATLQDNLIDAGFLPGRSTTPRRLEENLQDRVAMGDAARQALDSLIGLFELARYGRTALRRAHRDEARAALRRVRLALMREGVAVQEVVT